jgi:exosortase A
MAATTDDMIAHAPSAAAAWRTPLLALGVALAALLALYWATAASMVDIWWRSETFAHGFVIVPISLYMIWTRREDLARLTPRPALSGALAALAAAALWVIAYTADVLVAQQLMLVVLLQSVVVTVLGWRVAWAMAFPLLYLFFAVPMGEDLEGPLMDFTARFTVKAIELTGVPVYADGRFISLPTGNWEVAQACSGIRYLIASVALGTLYAYLTYRSLWRRALFIALAVLVPILANGLRAFGIVMLGHASDMKLAVGVDHIIYGWVFFGIVMLGLFWLGALWRDDGAAPSSSAVPEAPAHPVSGTRYAAAVLAAVLAVAAGPAGSAWVDRPLARAGYPVALQPASGWSGPEAAAGAWENGFEGESDAVRGLYRRDGAEVYAYLLHYRQEGQGAELINSQNRLYGGKDWRVSAEGRRTLDLGSGRRLDVQEVRYQGPAGRRVVWQWYEVAGWRTADPRLGKLLGAWSRLARRPVGDSLLALAAPYDTQPEEAESALRGFLSAAPSWTLAGNPAP